MAAGLCLALSAEAETVLGTNGCADSMAYAAYGNAALIAWSRASAMSNYIPEAESAQEFHDASLEEVLWLSPDRLLTSRRWLSQNSGSVLDGTDIRVTRIPYARDWSGVVETLRTLSNGADVETFIQTLEAQRSAITPLPHVVNALYLRPTGGTAGARTSLATLFDLAGLTNHASTLGIIGWKDLSLEEVLINPPDVFVVGEFAADRSYAKSTFARHPVLESLMNRVPTVTIEGQAWGCNNHHLIAAASQLNKAVRGALFDD